MKFGEKLKVYCIPEWYNAYIRYKGLKKFLKRHKPSKPLAVSLYNTAFFSNDPQASPKPGEAYGVDTADHQGEREDFVSFNRESSVLRKEEAQSDAIRTPLLFISNYTDPLDGNEVSASSRVQVALREFLSLLDQEIQKVEQHFQEQKQLLIEHTNGIEEEAAMLQMDRPLHHRERIQKSLLYVWSDIDKLQEYVNMNSIALYKILKKRDKLYGIRDASEDLNQRTALLMRLTIEPEIKEKILRLFEATTEGSPDVISAIHGFYCNFQRDMMRKIRPNYGWIMFFLGAFIVCLLDLYIIAWIPSSSPTYDLQEVLKAMPTFRMVLMIILLLWGIGGAMNYMDAYGVNYSFLLEIDPKCQVTANTMFTIASIQSIVWIICTALFVADSKFALFGYASSYWVLPTVLVIFEIGSLLYPTATFRNKYKKNFAMTVGKVLKSSIFPFKDITLLENVIGDFFTSLSKPFGDLERTIVYFSVGRAETIVTAADLWLRPIIFCFPYHIRFMQCLGRYRDTSPNNDRRMHLLNMGKYLAAIAVTIVTSIRWEKLGMSTFLSRLIWVCSYLFTTLYMLFWDVYYDWGLMPDPDNFIRPSDQIMYPKLIYYLIATTNLLCRLTWALNLMPIGLIDSNTLTSNIITFAISALEIYRRCSWLILRFENEHLRNSSRYRSVLWVPRKNW